MSVTLTDRDVVVIVDSDQVAKLKVTGHGGSLRGNTFHNTAITEEHVGVVVEQVEARLVEDGTRVGLGHSETDGVSETLTKRSSGDLNSRSVVGLGVTGGNAVNLLKDMDISTCLFHMAQIYLHGSSSGHQWTHRSRRGGAEHIAACNRDRCYSMWVS